MPDASEHARPDFDGPWRLHRGWCMWLRSIRGGGLATYDAPADRLRQLSRVA